MTLIEIHLTDRFFSLVLISLSGTLLLLTCLVTVAFYYIKKRIRTRLRLENLDKKFGEELLEASIISQERERKRIASDLHDDVGPLLSLVGFYLDEIAGDSEGDQQNLYVQARQLLNTAISQVRKITNEMAPHTLQQLGLHAILKEILSLLGESRNIRTSIMFNEPDLRLDPEQELMAFRVVQEIINNIVKHSGPGFIHMSQYQSNEKYIIEIRHDGEGLEQETFEQLRRENKALGLKNISSRLQAGGGQVLFLKEEKVYSTSITIPLAPVN